MKAECPITNPLLFAMCFDPCILFCTVAIPCSIAIVMHCVAVSDPRPHEHLRQKSGKGTAIRTYLNSLVAEWLH